MIKFKYGSTWSAPHGWDFGGTLQPALEFSGTNEHITEVYVHTYYPWAGSSLLINGLLFRTNLGRQVGNVDLSNPGLVRAFPCPTGQYMLAYAEGMGADASEQYVNEVKLYW